MSKLDQINIIYRNQRFKKDRIYNNPQNKISNPEFHFNNTLRKYIHNKLHEAKKIKDSNKQLFKKEKKNNNLKSLQGIIQRNNNNTKENIYFSKLMSKDNLKLFSSARNFPIPINQNNKSKEKNLVKSVLIEKKDKKERNRYFSDYKINEYKLRTKSNKKEYSNKSSNKINNNKYFLNDKMQRIKTMDNNKNYMAASNIINIKLKNNKNYSSNKKDSSTKHNEDQNKNSNDNKTFTRFNSSDFKDLKNKYININPTTNNSNDKSKNNIVNLSLSQRISNIIIKRIKNNENKQKNNINKKNIKKFIEGKNLIKIKHLNKNDKKIKINKNKNKIISTNFNSNNSINTSKNKFVKINQNFKENNRYKKVKINNDNNMTNYNRIGNNYYIPKIKESEPNYNSSDNSIYNIRFKDKKLLEGYELYWNLKNDYSKDIDISLISINNHKKPGIKNYKLCPNKFYNTFNDNSNINNIYLNNIQNVNNINNKQDNLGYNNNKEEYFSKIELLESENKLLKDEIKESKNRISILENKIEELLDDKNSKENSVCPQPTPYVIRYFKDIVSSKMEEKKNQNNQKKTIKKDNNDNKNKIKINKINEENIKNKDRKIVGSNNKEIKSLNLDNINNKNRYN